MGFPGGSVVKNPPANAGDTAFLNYQCKEIEGNNRMGKTRDLFKKIRDTTGTFHAKMGLILWIKKQESSRKTSISALLTMPKPLTVWITINCGKF